MSILEDANKIGNDQGAAENFEGAENLENPIPGEPQGPGIGEGLINKLMSPTGEGPVESYENHPLNFDKRTSTARIIRGLTGVFNNLNYAVIDIILGLLEKWKERKTNAV